MMFVDTYVIPKIDTITEVVDRLIIVDRWVTGDIKIVLTMTS